MKKNTKIGRWALPAFGLIALLLFGLLFVLNRQTVLLWDDLDYSFVITADGTLNQRVRTLGDIFASQKTMWQTWGGRNLLHGLAQFFLSQDKLLFDVCNSLAFLVLLWAVYQNSGLHGKRLPVFLLLSFWVFWYFLPDYGQSTLWLVGSCNYLWGSLLMLLALVPWRRVADGARLPGWFAPLAFLGGVLGGWTNENTGATLIGMMVLYLLYFRFGTRRPLRPWMVCSLAGALLGWGIMMISPGNWIRADSFEKESLLTALVKRFLSITTILVKRNALLAVALALALLYFWWQKGAGKTRRQLLLALAPTGIYALGTLAAIYSMLASPTFPDRVWMGILALMAATLGNALALSSESQRLRLVLLCVAVLLLPKFAVDCKNAYEDVTDTKTYWAWAAQEIETQRDAGTRDIALPIHYPASYYAQRPYETTLADVWPNTTLAQWYDVDSIRFYTEVKTD